MIIESGGRASSKRTAQELEELIQKELASLSPEERETVEIMFRELDRPDNPAEPKLVDVVGHVEYKRTPVDMRTFVLDEEFLGKTCDSIYPRLLDDLTELFEGGYHEAIFTGSIGYGKTFVATIGICRVLYELSCMANPHESYGLAKDSNISIVNLSVNEALAVKVVFENIATKIKASPYFEKFFPFEDTKKELRFPGNIWVTARASTDTSALGLNAIAAIIDETNFMPKTSAQQGAGKAWGHYDRAETLYDTMKRRMKSRFARHGKSPCKLFIVSSKKTLDDFTARRVRESKTDPTVFVRDYALWDVKPEEYFSAQKFCVLSGNEQTPSRILEEEEVDAFREALPEGAVIVDVPEDFRPDFERDLEGSLRDIAGVATIAINPFIHRREKIQDAVDVKREHPFSTLSYDRSIGGKFLWEKMVKDTAEREFGGGTVQRLRPIINPKATRHIHIDLAVKHDAAGFCMAHLGGFKDVPRRSDEGAVFLERAPLYIVDLVLRIVPPPGDEIIFGDIRRMIYELQAHGYFITKVSLDGFQSTDMFQQLEQRGFTSVYQSMDISPEPYENLKAALYEDRIQYYDYPPLSQELQQLEDNRAGSKRKIDHPLRGSKDCADALAGVMNTLSTQSLDGPLPIIKGLSVSREEDIWMNEQQQAVMAGDRSAGINHDVLLPIYGGGFGRKF